MKTNKLVTTAILASLVLFATACSDGALGDNGKRGSSGKTLEVLIISNAGTTAEGTSTRILVDSLMRAPQQGLMQAEPMFDLVYLPRSSYENTNMFRTHRNLILLDINKDNPDKVYFYRDREATPQIMFEYAARSRHSLDSMLALHIEQMTQLIYENERRRIEKIYKGSEGYKVEQQVRKGMGVNIVLSEEFRLADMRPNFCWVRKETKDFGLHVLIHKENYTNRSQFDSVAVLKTIDSMMALVPASIEGSYIGTERRLDFKMRHIMIDSSVAVETRGLWRAFGDYMGGPFVSYTLVTPDNKEVLTLVGFTYSPRLPKRDFIMQLESICQSVTFPKSNE